MKRQDLIQYIETFYSPTDESPLRKYIGRELFAQACKLSGKPYKAYDWRKADRRTLYLFAEGIAFHNAQWCNNAKQQMRSFYARYGEEYPK